jgi:hypothetical protein
MRTSAASLAAEDGDTRLQARRGLAIYFAVLVPLSGKIGARTKEALIEAMGRALAAVSTQDVRGFFVNCGYRAPAQQL